MIDIPHGTRPANDTEAILLSELLAATAATKERRAGFWIPVPWQQWREILGCRYKVAMRQAVEAGYVEGNDRYSVGRFCKSYRLAERYRHPQTQEYWLSRSVATNRIRVADTDFVGLALAEQFPTFRLEGNTADWDGFCAAQIQRGSFYATRCQYGRFHSTFTGLRREVRAQLTADGGLPLCEVDVANCQPLLLGLLAANSHSQPQPTTPNPHHNNTPHTPYTICRAFLGDRNLHDYLTLCERGELYEHLERRVRGLLTLRDCIPVKSRNRYATDRPLNRKDIKRQFLVMLFADVATTKCMPLFDVVATDWPSLADYILQAKRDCYQSLARDCQRLESRIMIDGAAGVILSDRRIPILTIHDAILTSAAHVLAVKAAIIAEFGRMGVTPTVKVDSDPTNTGQKDQHWI